MRTTIKIDGNEYNFWMPDEGGYVRLEEGNNFGVLGRQICNRGFFGNTLTATPETFKKKCTKWAKMQRRR